MRAYGGAARDCLRSAPTQHKLPRVELRMQVSRRLCAKHNRSYLHQTHAEPAPSCRCLLNFSAQSTRCWSSMLLRSWRKPTKTGTGQTAWSLSLALRWTGPMR